MLENVVCLVSDIPRRIYSTFVLPKGKLGLNQLKDTVGENIIATIKMRNNFCYLLKMLIFPILLSQYWTFLFKNFLPANTNLNGYCVPKNQF